VLIIGTPTRFQRGKQIGTYVGMIPSEDSSAGKGNDRPGLSDTAGRVLGWRLLTPSGKTKSNRN
jgi:hypothetical protein